MKILFCAQAEHLQNSTLRSLQAAFPQALIEVWEDLPSSMVSCSGKFLGYSRLIWSAGALPRSEWEYAARRAMLCNLPLLALGTAAWALAEYSGAKIAQKTGIEAGSTERLQLIHAPDSVLRHLPRQIANVPILQPQYSMTQLPNSLSTLAKNEAGEIFAWKHRTRAAQGIVPHPLQGDWAGEAAKIWLG